MFGIAGIGGGARPRWKDGCAVDTDDIAASDLKNLLARFLKFMMRVAKTWSASMRQFAGCRQSLFWLGPHKFVGSFRDSVFNPWSIQLL